MARSAAGGRRGPGEVSLNRALSKLGIASRSEATGLVRAGRVRVDGQVVLDPEFPVVPERAHIEVHGETVARAPWRMVAFHKPRGVVTTRRDPQGRQTVFDLLTAAGTGLIAVGRLDLATSGLLLLTTDRRLADWLTDPANAVPRVYVVSVRGPLADNSLARLQEGLEVDGERLAARSAAIRKRSGRETHLVLELAEGRNREVRRLLEAVGHEVTRLRRVSFGGIELERLAPGEWRDVTIEEVRRAFPGAEMKTP
jgi:23S rRNA pseudouridine2605 synthase